jgi:hypothetical protein
MPGLAPLFVSGMADKVAVIAVKCLAVAGGFLAGFVIGGVAAWAFDRWVFARKTPDFVKQAVRVLSGLAVAILVAMIVFGDGSGGGLFGGSGDGTGTGTPQNTDSGKKSDTPAPSVKPPDPKVVPPKVDAVRTPEVKPTDVVIRVTFLGGADVTGDRFYQLDDDPAPKTFEELKAAITKRKESEPRKVYLAVQFPARNRIAEDSVNVTQVTEWARNSMGIEVLWPGKK